MAAVREMTVQKRALEKPFSPAEDVSVHECEPLSEKDGVDTSVPVIVAAAMRRFPVVVADPRPADVRLVMPVPTSHDVLFGSFWTTEIATDGS
jgi:hypothetical protein